jgi:hypothetical protein
MTIDEALRDGPLPLALLAERLGRNADEVILEVAKVGYDVLWRDGNDAKGVIIYPRKNDITPDALTRADTLAKFVFADLTAMKKTVEAMREEIAALPEDEDEAEHQ